MTTQALSFEQRLARWHYDHWLTGALVVLLTLGLVMVYSSTIAMRGDGLSLNTSHVFKHAVFICFGLATLWLVSRVPVSALRVLSKPLVFATLILMLLVYVPGIGVGTTNGSSRWIGVMGFTFQPSELMKVVFVIYFADYVSKHGETLRSIERGLVIPAILLVIIGGILVKAPDVGTAVVIGVTAGLMLFLSGMRLSHFLFCLFIFALLLWLVYELGDMPEMGPLFEKLSYIRRRVDAWLYPTSEEFINDAAYQLVQSKVAIVRGDWFGVGLGLSVQKLSYLPHANNDFLLAILAEELGVLTVLAVTAVFGIILWRAFAISRQAILARNIYAARLAQGIGIVVVVQAMISIGVNTGALPTKGLTLPFLGTGGSGLITNCIAIGLLLGCERSIRPRSRKRR